MLCHACRIRRQRTSPEWSDRGVYQQRRSTSGYRRATREYSARAEPTDYGRASGQPPGATRGYGDPAFILSTTRRRLAAWRSRYQQADRGMASEIAIARSATCCDDSTATMGARHYGAGCAVSEIVGPRAGKDETVGIDSHARRHGTPSYRTDITPASSSCVLAWNVPISDGPHTAMWALRNVATAENKYDIGPPVGESATRDAGDWLYYARARIQRDGKRLDHDGRIQQIHVGRADARPDSRHGGWNPGARVVRTLRGVQADTFRPRPQFWVGHRTVAVQAVQYRQVTYDQLPSRG